ncbi:oligosaccharide flippase family protein, partial [Calditrichota bacterium]
MTPIQDLLPGLKSELSLKRNFNQGVFWNFISLGVQGVAGMAANLIIISLRGPEAIGIFNQVHAFYMFLSQIAVGGIHFSVLKSVSHNQKDLRKCIDLTVSGMILALVLSLIVVLPSYIFRETAGHLMKSENVALGLTVALPGLVFFSLNKVLLNVLNGLRRMRAYAVFQALRFIFILTTASIMIRFNLDRDGVLLPFTLTATEVLIFIICLIYVNLSLSPTKLTRRATTYFREHIVFGMRGFLSGVLGQINTRIDVLMLGYFSDDKTVGIYTFASVIAEGFASISFIVRRNVDPLLGAFFSKSDVGNILLAIKRIRRVFVPLMAILGIAAIFGYSVFR